MMTIMVLSKNTILSLLPIVSNKIKTRDVIEESEDIASDVITFYNTNTLTSTQARLFSRPKQIIQFTFVGNMKIH